MDIAEYHIAYADAFQFVQRAVEGLIEAGPFGVALDQRFAPCTRLGGDACLTDPVEADSIGSTIADIDQVIYRQATTLCAV